MQTRKAQALKSKYDFSMDDIGTPEFIAKGLAVRLSVFKGNPGELSPKEIICCIMATD